jgi:hypothetical protein
MFNNPTGQKMLRGITHTEEEEKQSETWDIRKQQNSNGKLMNTGELGRCQGWSIQ